MKKSTFAVLSAFALLFAFSACKKDYTCSCNVNIPGIGSADTTYVIEKSSKKDAESNCNNTGTQLSSTAAIVGGTASCSL